MHVIDFIGTHLKDKFIQNLPVKIYSDINSIDCFTGKSITEGVLKKDLIKDVFTDHQYIRFDSEYCSVETALCLQRIIPQSLENKAKKLEKKKAEGKNIDNIKDEFTSLRNYHFLCTERELRFLKREDIQDILFSEIPVPFVLVVTFGFKKHTTFKSKLNLSNKNFIITTDKGDVKINIEEVKELFPILQKWYTVLPEKIETKDKQTFFSKDDILFSCSNSSKIERYGLTEYFTENQIIAKYRGTLYLELLAYILNKREGTNA